MADASLAAVIRHVRGLCAAESARGRTDGQLLQAFACQRDPAAFAELVRRHGPLVLGVCRGVLRREPDAEDAFQATFLVLVQSIASVRKRESLAGWLHGVAYRVAMKARRTAARRRVHEGQARTPSPRNPAWEAAWREVQAVLHEEVQRLPAKYREAFVLCCLENHSSAEAARRLGVKEGTVWSRLAEARRRLQRRLTRRGVELSAVLAASALARDGTGAQVSACLAASAVKAACLVGAGQALTAGGVSAEVSALVEGVSKGMGVAKMKLVAAVLAALGLLAAGAGLVAHQTLSTRQPEGQEARTPEPLAAGRDRPKPEAEKQSRTDRHGDPLPQGAITRMGTIRFRHGGVVNGIAFSPDGKVLASAGYDHSVRLWDRATGKEIRCLANPPERPNAYSVSRWVYCVAFSADGRLLAAGEFAPNWPSNTIRVWEAATGKERFAIQKHQRGVQALAFSPDGKRLASASADQTVRLWDTTTGREVHSFAHQDQATCVAFAPDGKTLATAGMDRTVRLWDVATGQARHQIARQQGGVGSIAFAPDGKTLASAGADRKIRFYAPATGKETQQLEGHADEVRVVAFSPDGKVLASAGENQTLWLWDVASGKKVRELKGHQTPVRFLAFSPDGKTLASVGSQEDNSHNLVRFWDVARGEEARTDDGHQSWVGFLAFTADGKTLVSASRDGTVRLWDPLTSKELRRFEGGLKRKCRGVTFSPDERNLALTDADGSFRLIERATGKELRRFAGHPAGVLSLAFAPDGKTIASGGLDKVVRLWDAATGQELRQIPHSGEVLVVLFSPDGKKVASIVGDRTVYLWDAASGQELSHLADNPGIIGGIAFSPDGKWLAVSCFDGTAVVREVDTGRTLWRFEKHPGYAQCVAFSPDGRLLGVGSWMSIRVWELATGNERTRFPAHEGDVGSLAFAPDGRTLASGSSDTTVLLWDLTGRMKAGQLAEARLSPDELRNRWNDLGDRHAGKASQAIWTLAAAPAQSVPLFRQHLQPVARSEAKKVEQLIKDLDDDNFGVREKATTELEKLGPVAQPALAKVLRESASAEVRRRAAALLEKLTNLADLPEHLQVLRAIEVLERINDRESRQLLETLAGGLPGAWLTQEAKDALARLARQPAFRP